MKHGLAQKKTIEGTVTDIDGNVYHTVTIGTQVWMVENLKTTKYRNGDSIPNVTDHKWEMCEMGAYCDYDNNLGDAITYGRLYNWNAVEDSRKISPEGWHVPSDAEWKTLINYLGGEKVAGGKLKETGISHWSSSKTGATNETRFTALPGGTRFFNGSFLSIGCNGYWWSATEYDIDNAWHRLMFYGTSNVGSHYFNKGSGLSVRCIKD
jgi:uncharacterized protein (TIGR02145 family)